MINHGQDVAVNNELPPKASLLGIPGEIRNRIYREVLLEEYTIQIGFMSFSFGYGGRRHRETRDKGTSLEPGLLRSCMTIRREARPIFFNENRFHIELYQAKMDPPLAHWFWQHVPRSQRKVTHEEQTSWECFKPWLKAHWAGQLAEHVQEDFAELIWEVTDNRVVWNMFKVVEELQDLRWEKVEKVLDLYAESVIIHDPNDDMTFTD